MHKNRRLRVLLWLILVVGVVFMIVKMQVTAQAPSPVATANDLIKTSRQHSLWMFSSETNLTQVADAGQNVSGLVSFSQRQLKEQENDTWQNGAAKVPDWGAELNSKYAHSEIYRQQGDEQIVFPKGSVLFGTGFKVLKTISGRNNGGFHYQGFRIALLDPQGKVLKNKGSIVTAILIYKVT